MRFLGIYLYWWRMCEKTDDRYKMLSSDGSPDKSKENFIAAVVQRVKRETFVDKQVEKVSGIKVFSYQHHIKIFMAIFGWNTTHCPIISSKFYCLPVYLVGNKSLSNNIMYVVQFIVLYSAISFRGPFHMKYIVILFICYTNATFILSVQEMFSSYLY